MALATIDHSDRVRSGPSHPSATGLGHELRADTDAGAGMVASAEALAARFAEGAAAHDRDATFAAEHLDELVRSGFLRAAVPAYLGGGGVGSVHDVVVAMSRLARADASTTIGVNMHFAVLLNIARAHKVAIERGESAKADALDASLAMVATSDVVFASAVSEPAPQDFTRPRTRATRTDDGWRIDGRKVFATMARWATLVNVSVAYTDERGRERYGFALVPPRSPGVEFADDWDALGMRGSDSGSVVFRDVHVGPGSVRDGFEIGRWSEQLFDRFLTSGAFHAAASLGIAEAAHSSTVAGLRRRSGAVDDPFVVMRLAESAVDLTTMRASLDRATRLIDEHHAAHPAGGAPIEELRELYAEVQAAKTHLNQSGSAVVDRCLSLSGGAGFMAGHPLARSWRDARAGAFMHPLGVNRAFVHLGRHALGASDEG